MTSSQSRTPVLALTSIMAASSLTASPEGKTVALLQQRTTQHLRASNFIGRAGVHAELVALAQSSQRPGWDGYDALAIDARSVEIAHQLIDVLPERSKRAAFSMGAEPDGQITFEWHKSPSWTLSVSISPFSEAHYAALLGPDRRYGTESLGFPIHLPVSLRELIQRIEAA